MFVLAGPERPRPKRGWQIPGAVLDVFLSVGNGRDFHFPGGRVEFYSAAVVSPRFGKWTIAVDEVLWKRTFDGAVLPPVFSPDSERVAARITKNGCWTMAVDGVPWEEKFSFLWDPVFSPDSRSVAAKAEKNGRFMVVLDGKPGKQAYDALWDPVFSPDGSKVLVRGIEGGKYYRSVIPVDEI